MRLRSYRLKAGAAAEAGAEHGLRPPGGGVRDEVVRLFRPRLVVAVQDDDMRGPGLPRFEEDGLVRAAEVHIAAIAENPQIAPVRGVLDSDLRRSVGAAVVDDPDLLHAGRAAGVEGSEDARQLRGAVVGGYRDDGLHGRPEVSGRGAYCARNRSRNCTERA
jgi:hypothetical protein